MHFFKALLVGASAFAVATAQLAFTKVPTNVVAGVQYTVEYSGGSGSVTVVLRKGAAADLKTIATISSGATGGTFSWTPDKGLANGADYALQITSGSETNYAGPITLTGGSGTSTGSVTSSSSGSTMTASAMSNATMSMSLNSTVTASTVTSNTTISKATLTSSATTTVAGGTRTTGTATGASGTTAPTTQGNSANVLSSASSPLAFVVCVLAGLVYLN